MKALIITSEFYGAANRIGSHHLARQFAKRGLETFVVSFPVSPFYCLSPKRTHYFERKAFSRQFTHVEKNIRVYVPNAIVPPLPKLIKHFPKLINHWHRFTVPNFSKVFTETLGNKVNLLLTDSLFFPFIKEFIQTESLIFRVPDYLPGFWGENRTLLDNEAALLIEADLVVTPSKQLQDMITNCHGVNTRYLPNGVDIERYQSVSTVPGEYLNSERPKAVYVGALKKWFNHNLLNHLAKTKPNWDFFIIGDNSGLTKLPSHENIYFLGEKPQVDCLPYIQHADVGIIPFQFDGNDLIKHINPIKLYDYLAAGIPVVSTRWKELELINAPIHLADSAGSFVNMMDNVLDDTSEEKAKRKAFAAQFSWDRITDSLLEMINPR